jgi:hypothetical protein
MVTGNPKIKSILMSSHFQLGIFKVWRGPADHRWSSFTLWQVSHVVTYLAISFFILVHQNLFWRPCYILLLLGWIEYLDKWASSNIFLRRVWSFGTTRWFLNHKIPLSSLKHNLSPFWIHSLNLDIPLSNFCALTMSSLMVGINANFVMYHREVSLMLAHPSKLEF